MIYTLTCNPAIDYVVRMDSFVYGETNRSTDEEIYYGGKGINVSMVLNALDIPNTAMGFISGFTGMAIEDGVREVGIKTDFIMLQDGFSRINVKIKSGKETEINGQGPKISDSDMEKLYDKLDQLVESDILVMAGSVPSTLSEDTYYEIMKRLKHKGVDFVVDATGELILKSLECNPFLIKPNKQELGDLFGRKLTDAQEIKLHAEKLQGMGARNILVSMGKEGAMLIAEDGQVFTRGIVEGPVQNTVGSGDSMVAGFLAGWLKTNDYDFSLKLGSAAGNATAFSKGIATKEMIMKIIDKL